MTRIRNTIWMLLLAATLTSFGNFSAHAASFYYINGRVGVSTPIVRVSLGSGYTNRPAYRVISPSLNYSTYRRLQLRAQTITLQRIAANQQGYVARNTAPTVVQNKRDTRPTSAPMIEEQKQFESFERTNTPPNVDLKPNNSNT